MVFFDSHLALKTLITWSYSWWSHSALCRHNHAWCILCGLRTRTVHSSYQERASGQHGRIRGRKGDTPSRHGYSSRDGCAGCNGICSRQNSGSSSTPPASLRPKLNLLLITFDAFSAEDMAVYGYRLPTTPNIDEFARKSTIFTNFYSGSTFTTSSVATMLTGLYPSGSRVYQTQSHVPIHNAE